MKSVFKTITLLLFGLSMLSGCIKELTPTNNGYVAKPIIWAILNTDSALVLITSGNKGISDKDIVDINTIDMFVYEDGIVVDQLLNQNISSDSQTHTFSFKPNPSKTYTIKLTNQMHVISGTTHMPSSLLKPYEMMVTQGESAQLKYSITDDLTNNDAYQFSVEIYHFGTLTDTATNDTLNKAYFFFRKFDKFEEPSLTFNFLGFPNSETYTYPVADNLFNGKKKTFLFSLQNPVSPVFYRPRELTQKTPVSDKLNCTKQYVLIKCRKISTDYYKFLVSSKESTAIFGTPFYQPTNVYTNIVGGLGLIGAFTERTDTVWIKK